MSTARKALHEDKDVSYYLIKSVYDSKALSVTGSKIASPGSGLIAKENIDQGVQIFKSRPHIVCVDFSLTTVCHFCLKDSDKLPLGKDAASAPSPKACTGCRRARFCSKDCHSKGWKLFHKDECKILRESPNLALPHLALYRILFRKKNNQISDQDAKILSLLDDHFKDYSDAEAGDAFFELASSIRATANPKVALSVVFRLLAAMQTNTIKMRQAEKSGSFGIALDFLCCAINHSCDPNVFLYVEDGWLIARSLRSIQSGEEITISYCEPMLPVTARRDYLEAEYFFRCFCKRCESDKREQKSMVPQTVKTLKDLRDAQGIMVRLINNTVAASTTPGKYPELENIPKMEADILGAGRRALNEGDWPEHMDPMPLVRNNLAQVYLNKSDLFPAIRNSLRGTLMCRYRSGPEWVNNLCRLTQTLVAIVTTAGPDAQFFNNGVFITLKDAKRAVCGYGLRLCKDAGTVFGDKSKYAEFLCEWYSWIARTAEDPKPGNTDFEGVFWDAQKSLLTWAEIDLGYGINLGEITPGSIDEMLSKGFRKLEIPEDKAKVKEKAEVGAKKKEEKEVKKEEEV